MQASEAVRHIGGQLTMDVYGRLGIACLSAALLISGGVHAACEDVVGRFVAINGDVEVQPDGGVAWRRAGLETRLCEGDTIRTGERSRVTVSLINDAVLCINQNTAMRLIDITPQENESSWLDVFKGAFQSFSRKPKFLKVNTPYLNGSVEGTEFVIRVDEDSTRLTVLEGTVVASNARGQVSVNPGEAAIAANGQAPTSQTVVRPRDEVHWALYYPPILSAGAITSSSPGFSEAVSCAVAGNPVCALAALDKVPQRDRDADYLLLRASTLLSVGRVKQAGTLVEGAISDQGQLSAAAHALRAVIRVTQNDVAAALADAERAVALDADLAAASIALSYAQQASLDLPAAERTLLAAIQRDPKNALAQARLAELQLMQGRTGDARESAARAVEIDSDLARSHAVSGFVALAEIRVREAQAAFERAIALDSADPLPHLGLGLAKIRQGALAEGRVDIEGAVALDSNNALLRAYLGKAYFEEKRDPLDARQLAVAMELDPNDPTAYLYDAIRLQTLNRPVEALGQVQASIARNDNRAVYRGRALLDQDRAARGTSLARVFNDLGFGQLGVNRAVDSLALDPANASAHRFLSDSYLSVERHETARVSELQQAQMLQQVNINPIQPSLSDTNLNVANQGGPANAGFNEFTPLFERNRAQLNVAGFVGSNETEGAEAVLSGVYDRYSLSAGAFFYDTMGFRANNDLKHELYNLFGQAALTPTVNVQAEYQKRNSDYGDLDMNFDPAVFSPNERNALETESYRLGSTIRFGADSTLMLLYNQKDVVSEQQDQSIVGVLPSPPFPPGLPPILQQDDFTTKTDSDQFEGAFVHQGNGFNLLVGAAGTDVDREDAIKTDVINPLVPGPIPIVDTVIDTDIEDVRGYVYANLVPWDDVTLTLGISHQQFDETRYDLTETQPKLGVQWRATDALTLRGAYFEVMKPALASNRTLEPTQVAGFNQFFDDVDATRSKRYGIGADWQPSASLAAGAELSRRELKSVTFDAMQNAIFDDRDEWTHRVYGYWAPTDRWALTAEGVYDRFENDDSSLVANIVPERVRTVTVPIKATYFHPNGLFGGVGITFVDQEVRRTAASTLPQGDSSFSVVDLAVGYRLPQRRGVLSLSVHNLTDEDFEYQDNSYREFGDEPSVAPFTPETVVMGRLMLSF